MYYFYHCYPSSDNGKNNFFFLRLQSNNHLNEKNINFETSKYSSIAFGIKKKEKKGPFVYTSIPSKMDVLISL